MQRPPRRVLRRPQTVARQHTLVHPPEFFHNQCLHSQLLALWNMLDHRSLNAGERIMLRMRDDLAEVLFDGVPPSQAKRVGLRQVLFERQLLLC